MTCLISPSSPRAVSAVGFRRRATFGANSVQIQKATQGNISNIRFVPSGACIPASRAGFGASKKAFRDKNYPVFLFVDFV